MLGQKVTVLEVFPNEDSQFLGVMIIMDMVVLMADGSIANIEIQKISYDFRRREYHVILQTLCFASIR